MTSTGTTLYKVLRDGRPAHGGSADFPWSLPRDGQPGEWVEHAGVLSMCSAGLHLTRQPLDWYLTDGVQLYEAEYEGEVIDDDAKLCVRRARLVREVAWSDVQVWHDSKHEVRSGRAIASGSASVKASGSASVVSTPYHSPSVSVALTDLAAHIDHRSGKLRLRAASMSEAVEA